MASSDPVLTTATWTGDDGITHFEWTDEDGMRCAEASMVRNAPAPGPWPGTVANPGTPSWDTWRTKLARYSLPSQTLTTTTTSDAIRAHRGSETPSQI